MQLRWVPRLWGARAMVLGQVIHFCQMLLALANLVKTVYESHC